MNLSDTDIGCILYDSSIDIDNSHIAGPTPQPMSVLSFRKPRIALLDLQDKAMMHSSPPNVCF